jgi:hypothetical protein
MKIQSALLEMAMLLPLSSFAGKGDQPANKPFHFI